MRLVIIFLIVYVVLFILGFFGFKFFTSFDWIDSLLNATLSMVGGNPLLKPVMTAGSKVFVIIFIILSHIAFIILFALIVAYLTDIERPSTFDKSTSSEEELSSLLRENIALMREVRFKL